MIPQSQTEHGDRRIVYVLPSYDPATETHLVHLYDFIRAAAGRFDLLLVVEWAAADPADLAPRAYRQRWSWPPLRFAELFFVLLSARIRGGRSFYVHYSFYGAIAAWLVTRLLGGTVYYWNSGMPWRYRRPWLTERVFRFILRHVTLVTDPPGLAAEYQRRYRLRPERVRVVPHYISVARFRPVAPSAEAKRRLGLDSGRKVALFVHRLSRRKGAHLLPEIAARVTARRKDVIFVIVGDGPERQDIESRIQNRALGTRVRVLGGVPSRDIVPYFHAADVLLLPSEEEGFPHVLLEAMAAGVPYVATDVGGVSEMTPPLLKPYIVPASDAARIADGVLALLALSAGDRARISGEERQWVMRYDVERAIHDFQSLLTEADRPA